MSFSQWVQKRWYVFLISVALGGALASILVDLFVPSLISHSIFVGALLGLAASYAIYKAENPGEE
jgi:hypothetical protein